jgi:hypothetical protein
MVGVMMWGSLTRYEIRGSSVDFWKGSRLA